jgi:chromosome segregation ATPase
MNAKKKDLAKELIQDILDESDLPTSTKPIESSRLIQKPPPTPDATVKLTPAQIMTTTHQEPQGTSTNLSSLRSTLGKMTVKTTGVQGFTEAALAQSESLRAAQQKILELEGEAESLRRENEKLAVAAEAIKNQADKLQVELDDKNKKLELIKETHAQEKEIYEGAARLKDQELKELRLKSKEYEARLSTHLQKIRVRERELENRLELIRIESAALSRSKYDHLMDLKRQIDQLNIEIDNYRSKTQELNQQLNGQSELVRRTVKALRLALSMLEGEVAEAPTSDSE